MHLQKLVIQGFKSFANKTSLEFTPAMTAIVGPNGSGKSNIADAVRWVLGEQSLKTLRGKKSGDVIFAGSDKKTRLGYCQVDLHLNNEDHKAPVDFSEIVISRKVYRDGEGEYYLNKNRVRLQDILMLLAKSNFGQRSYSIIGQGTVDLFLSATPMQRKEYFDEAAGVRQFQIKKEQAENKLRQTKENLKQAEMLIQEIAPRLRSLTRQVHRLEKREEVTKQLKEIQHTYYAGLWHDLKKKQEIEEKNYQQVEIKRKTTADELESIQTKMQQLALGTTRQEEFQRLQREYDQVITEKNNLLRDQAVIKGKIEIDRKQAGELNLVWLEKKQEQLQNEINNLKQIVEEDKKNIAKYSEMLGGKGTKYQEIISQYQNINQQLEEAKIKLTHKKTIAIPEVAKEVAGIYSRQKAFLEKIENVQTPEDIRSLKAEIKTLTSELAQLNHRLGDAGAGDPHEIINLQDQLNKLLTVKDELITSINEIKIKFQVAKEKENINQKRFSELNEELEKITKDLESTAPEKTPEAIAADALKEEKFLSEKINTIDNKLKEINNQLSGFNKAEQDKKEEIFTLQKAFSDKQSSLNKINSQLNAVKIELAKLETRLEDLEKEMIDELNDEERKNIFELQKSPSAQSELFSEIQKLKRQLELIGGIDPQVAEEYKETKERYDFLTKQSDDLNKAIEDLEKAITNLDETVKKQFNKAFEQINKHFSEYFKILFEGGRASLSLVKEEVKDIEDEDEDGDKSEEDEKTKEKQKTAYTKIPKEKVVTGIDVYATPPGKRLRGINMLSGGERALTSIALICAIIHNNPSPFVILDEVDAALDESNSIRFASIIDKLSKKTQFIIITHNRATMNQSHILYGVTMGDDGISKLLSINMEEAEKVINE
jgi:chromosome segregation protein